MLSNPHFVLVAAQTLLLVASLRPPIPSGLTDGCGFSSCGSPRSVAEPPLLWTWPSSAPHQFPRFPGGPKPLCGHPACPEVKSNRNKRTGPFLCTIQPDGQAVDQSSRTVFLIPNWNGAHVRIQKGFHTSSWYQKWHRRWQISFLQHLEVKITCNYGNQLISVLLMSHKHWFYS